MNYTSISNSNVKTTASATPKTSSTVTSAAGTGDGPSIQEPNSAVERTVQLTSFIDNQNTIQDCRPGAMSSVPMDLLRQRDTEGTDIHKVAARPVFIFNVNWSAADVPGTLLAFVNLPKDILNVSAIKREKMQRYQFFSADIVIRVVASSMAFQAGRLWMSFEAAREQRGTRLSSLNVQAITSLDGLEFDPATPTPLEFKVKYFAPMSEWDQIGQYGFGSVLFSVLSPLNSASSSSTMTFSMQAWFENLTFGVPSTEPFNLGAVPQRMEREMGPPEPLIRAFRQSNVEKDEAEKHHVISDTLETVSEVAGVIGEVPLLGAVARPVSWASGLAAKAARMFGFSKPNVSNAPIRMEIFPQSTAHFMDGSSDAVTLTATSNFEIPQGPVFGTEFDEMDIAYVCSRMPVIGGFNWDTTAAIGAPLAVIPVMPGLCAKTAAAQNVSYGTYAATPMAYVSTMFKYWAGALKFRLEAVSTPFHAGRLLAVYVPNFDPFGTFNITECANNYSIVWDITTSSHIEFEVPYMSNSPYLETFIDTPNLDYILNGETSGTAARDRLRKVSNGSIVLFVLNQLVAPSTASNTIQILLWMGGGKDITFAEPTLGEFAVSANRDLTDNVAKYYDGTVMTQPSTNFTAARRDAPDPVESVDWITDDSDSCPSGEDRPWFRRSNASVRPIRQMLPRTPRNTSKALNTNFLSDMMALRNIAPAKEAVSKTNSVHAPNTGVDENMLGSAQNDANFENWMPMNYVDPMSRAQLVTGECITSLRMLTRRMSPAYTIMPLSATSAGQLTVEPPTSNHVLCIDMDNFSSRAGSQDDAIYRNTCGRVVSGGNRWIITTPTFLSYISYLYTYVRGSRRFLICSRPSNVINGAPFNSGTKILADALDPVAPGGTGEFDVRVSQVVSNEPYTFFPWFRPEETIIDYNNLNEAYASISSNFTYGLGSLYASDAYVKRIGSDGTSLEVSAPSGTTYPIRLLADPDAAPATYNARVGATIPRKRRFLEIRYRPQTTAQREVTANFPATVWPLPTTIYEAASDDLSFGYLQQPPLITRINKTHIFVKNDGSLLRL